MLTQRELVKKKRDHRYLIGSTRPMSPTKVESFLEEFPWIRNIVKGSIDQVFVSRVNPSLLNYESERVDFGGLFDSSLLCEEIYLVNGEGKVIPVEKVITRKKYFIFGPSISKIERIYDIGLRLTIYSAINAMGEKADSIAFILSYYEYTGAVIVYTLPKDVSMSGWIKKEFDLEKTKLQKSIRG